MKRVIGLSLLILANIAILAHAVIPHHHHGNIIVAFGQVFSEEGVSGQEHENCCHKCHEHESAGHASTDDCILSKLYVRSSTESANFNTFGIPYFHPHFSVICRNAENQLQALSCLFLPFRQKPHIEFSPNNYIARSLGLRAPPAC